MNIPSSCVLKAVLSSRGTAELAPEKSVNPHLQLSISHDKHTRAGRWSLLVPSLLTCRSPLLIIVIWQRHLRLSKVRWIGTGARSCILGWQKEGKTTTRSQRKSIENSWVSLKSLLSWKRSCELADAGRIKRWRGWKIWLITRQNVVLKGEKGSGEGKKGRGQRDVSLTERGTQVHGKEKKRSRTLDTLKQEEAGLKSLGRESTNVENINILSWREGVWYVGREE